MIKQGSGFVLLVLMIIFSLPDASKAVSSIQSEQDERVIGTRVVPPFVMKDDNGNYSGITISLWEHIAAELDLDYSFREESIQGMIDGVSDGNLFASASALTITSEREEVTDFTHPYIITGLGIATSYKPAGLLEAVKALFSKDFLWVVFLLLGLLFIWGFFVWLFERKENSEEFGGTPSEGIGSGFWWAAVTMTTVGYGDKAPRTFWGRVIGFVWMFTAIIVVSFFTASIASSLTVTQLATRVSGPDDLPFVRVGVLENSATLTFLRGEGIGAETYETIDAGLQAVERDEIDAFVHDAPIIQFYAQRDFRNKVRVLPNTFNDQYYGIVLPPNSEYRDEMNKILLDYIQTDEWKDLNSKYLGDR